MLFICKSQKIAVPLHQETKIMKRKFSLFFVFLVLHTPANPLFAWGQEGHRIIAQVAYDNLSYNTRRKIDKVLGTHGAIYVANWADEIKSDTIYPYSHNWHYQDLPAGLSDSALVATLTDYPKEGGNMFRAIDSLTNALRANKRDKVALTFLIHLMGDRFCPMHIGHIDDKGGNRVKCKWFGKNTNLHSIWDGKIIESRGYSYSEYAQYLEDKWGGEKKAILVMSEADILRHNYILTSSIYDYQTTWNENAYHYVYRWAEPMEWQLYAAGVRLAKLLEEIY